MKTVQSVHKSWQMMLFLVYTFYLVWLFVTMYIVVLIRYQIYIVEWLIGVSLSVSKAFKCQSSNHRVIYGYGTSILCPVNASFSGRVETALFFGLQSNILGQ